MLESLTGETGFGVEVARNGNAGRNDTDKLQVNQGLRCWEEGYIGKLDCGDE